MPLKPPSSLLPLALALTCLFACNALAVDHEISDEDELLIEIDDAVSEEADFSIEADDEISVEEGDAVPNSDEDGELVIDSGPELDRPSNAAQGIAGSSIQDDDRAGFELRIDDARAEYAYFTDSDSEADYSLFGMASALANWQPSPAWELQLAGRIDGHEQDGSIDYSTLDADYGDSFVRFTGEQFRLTAGTQTIVWGRLDELPLSDRISTADLTRFVLDDLEDRRRSNPVLRAEAFFGSGKLDVVWLYDFRAAELPDRESIWYPINRETGRIIGIDPRDIPPALVRNASISEDEPSGEGGFGARYTRTHSLADFGVTIARTRQSVPYFRVQSPNTLAAVYPRSWAYGLDAAIDTQHATLRFEVLYSSDNPVTRTDLSYTTTPGLAWGIGAEMHPGDGDTRISLQLMGSNLIDAPEVIDRTEMYNLNGEIDVPFDRARWRASLDFILGLDEKDVYLNPEIAFLGWEPHELYLALHYFDGDDQTLGGFHEDHASINLGWRASF